MEPEVSIEPMKQTPACPPLAWRLLGLLALIEVAVHCATNMRYGFFRDELYYIQWSERLAWGYVEQPPLTAVVIWLTRHLLGHSLLALRLPSALAGAVVVFLGGAMAREMGGRRFAQGLTALCVLVAPIFLATHALLTMNMLDHLFWAVCTFLLVRLCRTGDTRLWWAFGLAAGLGLMSKLSMLFFGVGVLAAVVLTARRKDLAGRDIWVGGALAVLLFAPFVLWLATHQWCTLEFMFNYGGGGKTTQAGPLDWLYMQVFTMHPLSAPIWGVGLWWCVAGRGGRPYRLVGWLFLVLYAMFFALKAKFYFLSPAFPMILAAGATRLEAWSDAARRRWIRPAYAGALLVSGALLAPMAMPVLPTDALVKYAAILGGNAGVRTEQLEEAELPQHFAGQFGWEEMVQGIAAVYDALPPDEQAACGIFTGNYGEAAAVDFYGPTRGLPNAISGHNTYHLWGPGRFTGEVVIAVVPESARDDLLEVFDSVEVKGRNQPSLAMPYERNTVFFLCRGIKEPLADVWPDLKGYG